jgi:very-short-patch-repair endonuclease
MVPPLQRRGEEKHSCFPFPSPLERGDHCAAVVGEVPCNHQAVFSTCDVAQFSPMRPSTPLTYTRAKRMRKQPTAAEEKLWGGLRNRALSGYKFHRQVPIGPYIVDFINHEFGIVVEVDGPTHSEDKSISKDERRTAYLCGLGLKICGVGNNDVFGSIGETLNGISLFVAEHSKSAPPVRRWLPSKAK